MKADQELVVAVGTGVRIGELGLVVLLVGHVGSSRLEYLSIEIGLNTKLYYNTCRYTDIVPPSLSEKRGDLPSRL